MQSTQVRAIGRVERQNAAKLSRRAALLGTAKAIAMYALLTAVAAIMVFPFLWMLSTAFKPRVECYIYPPTLIPTRWSLENIRDVMARIPIWRYIANTAYLATVGTLANILVCTMAAYSFARLRFPGRDQIFFLYLGTMMIPHAVTMIPSFVLMRYLGWMDTWRAIIIPGMGSAFGTFLMRQFFLSIPNELEDAARIDGAGRARVFVQILIPLAVPALVTLTIFGFRSRWNEFLWPLLVLSTKEKFPIQVGLSAFRYEFGTLTHLMMTGAAMSVLPLMILFMAAQKYFVRGVVLSGIKG